MATIWVLYRVTGGENKKPRPEWFSKALCAASINDAIAYARARELAVISVAFHDSSSGPLAADLQAQVARFDRQFSISGGSSSKSWRRLLGVVDASIPFADEDILYFVEDDHLHHVESLDFLATGAADYRFLYSRDSEFEPLSPVGWRNCVSGVTSFATTGHIYRADRFMLKLFSGAGAAWDNLTCRVLSGQAKSVLRSEQAVPATVAGDDGRLRHHPLMRKNFRRAWRFVGLGWALIQAPRTLQCAMPNLAAHCELRELPEGLDWENIAADVAV